MCSLRKLIRSGIDLATVIQLRIRMYIIYVQQICQIFYSSWGEVGGCQCWGVFGDARQMILIRTQIDGLRQAYFDRIRASVYIYKDIYV